MFRPRTLCQMKPAPSDPSLINPHKTSLPINYFQKFPQYIGNQKEFPSKTKKPLQITTKGYLVQKIDKKYIEEIQPKEQMIDFNKLLLQFKSSEEIKSLQVKDLLDIDGEMLEELKKKCQDFTNAASNLSEEKEKLGHLDEAKSDQEFMQYLMAQYVKMQDNNINLDIAVNNIDRLQYLQYNDYGVKVYFKHKK